MRNPIDLPANRVELATVFGKLGFTKGAEIGVEQGLYSEVLCKAIPGLSLLCVDAWKAYRAYREHVTQEKLDGFYEATKRRLAAYDATLLREFSVDAAQRVLDGSLDFVYIDGNHRYEQVVADLAAWVPKVRAGGIVAGHDYRKDKGRGCFHVPQAVGGWTSAYGVTPWFVLRGDNAPTWFWVKRG